MIIVLVNERTTLHVVGCLGKLYHSIIDWIFMFAAVANVKQIQRYTVVHKISNQTQSKLPCKINSSTSEKLPCLASLMH